MNATTDDTVLIDNDFVGNPKCHNLVSHLDEQVGEVVFTTIGPFEFHGLKGWVAARYSDVFLYFVNRSTNCAIDAVLGNENTPVQTKSFTQCTLPKSYGIGVANWRELVIQENFRGTYVISLYAVYMAIRYE